MHLCVKRRDFVKDLAVIYLLGQEVDNLWVSLLFVGSFAHMDNAL